MTKIEPKVRNARFVQHIENHLKQMFPGRKPTPPVICKICGKTIDEIAQDEEITVGEKSNAT